MRPFKHALHAPRALWIAAACAAAIGAAFACTGSPSNIHDTDEAKGKPCLSCHSGAYSAAKNPVHVDQMPQTCQDCHNTTAWAPSSATNHIWWPIENKHVGVSCVACHTKGYKVGDTSKDCLSCHRKDYESALNTTAAFPQHALNGVDQYPLDCTMCHADTGWKPSPWKHQTQPLELIGVHKITPCAGCHIGTAPDYKGTQTDCYTCHKADFDTKAPAKRPDHTTFPHTCLNCHLMSGWLQGPPLGGLHPDAKFPITTGVHAAVGTTPIVCLDCHKLEKGFAAGGSNTDCVNCHVNGDHHVSPAIDDVHLHPPDGGAAVGGYPQGASTTNFCLLCHAQGQHL